MLSTGSMQKDLTRLRTRASFRKASADMSSPPRSTPRTDTFSSDSEKLDFLCNEMKKVGAIAQEIKELRRQNEEKDKRINELENRLDDLEQYSRQDNIIITGFNYQHLSYSRAYVAPRSPPVSTTCSKP